MRNFDDGNMSVKNCAVKAIVSEAPRMQLGGRQQGSVPLIKDAKTNHKGIRLKAKSRTISTRTVYFGQVSVIFHDNIY